MATTEQTVPTPDPVSSPASNDTPSPTPDGPLSSLAHRAASSAVLRTAADKLPSSARPHIVATAQRAAPVLAAVDRTLQTDEARNVASSAYSFGAALLAFAVMLFAGMLTYAEYFLGIDTSSSDTSDAQSSAGQRDLDSEDTPQNAQQVFTRLASRCLTISYVALSKAGVQVHSAVQRSLKKGTDGGADTSSAPYDPHSVQSLITDRLHKAAKVVVPIATKLLASASQYSGAGHKVVVPVAQRIISVLPEDSKRAVSESQASLASSSPMNAEPAGDDCSGCCGEPSQPTRTSDDAKQD